MKHDVLIPMDLHLAAFEKLAASHSTWKGGAPRSWARALPSYKSESLPDRHLKREDLRSFCRTSSTTDEDSFVACMAWGGMNRRHARVSWEYRERWRPLVRDLREGLLSREQAYQMFADTKIPGLGPAYFTKLIHFLRPQTDGYILDQWTGKSVSLLFAPRFITITTAGWVTRANCAAVYLRYCEAVESLGTRLGLPGAVAEEMMFSTGGRNKHAWRAYVVANWQPI